MGGSSAMRMVATSPSRICAPRSVSTGSARSWTSESRTSRGQPVGAGEGKIVVAGLEHRVWQLASRNGHLARRIGGVVAAGQLARSLHGQLLRLRQA